MVADGSITETWLGNRSPFQSLLLTPVQIVLDDDDHRYDFGKLPPKEMDLAQTDGILAVCLRSEDSWNGKV
jgi:hypothetical protein